MCGLSELKAHARAHAHTPLLLLLLLLISYLSCASASTGVFNIDECATDVGDDEEAAVIVVKLVLLKKTTCYLFAVCSSGNEHIPLPPTNRVSVMSFQ